MTKSAKPRLGAGDITVTLGDEDFTLKPSLRAARRICQRYGSLVKAAQSAAMADIEAVIAIIAAGLDLTPKGVKEYEERIFEAGMAEGTGNLGQLCVEFCNVLMGGGRLPDSDNEEASHDKPDPPSSKRGTRSSSTG